MNVVVFGATGGVGREVVRRLLDGGHAVRAFVRDAVRVEASHDRLEIFTGDVFDAEAVQRAVKGQDAAIIVIGVRDKADRESLVSEGVANIVPALERAGVGRVAFLSIMGVGHSRRNLGVMRHVLPRVLKDAFAHREIAEDSVRRSGLEWVIVRAVRLVDRPATGRYRAGEDVRVGMFTKISRADVAEFMVGQLSEDRYLRQAPSIAA